MRSNVPAATRKLRQRRDLRQEDLGQRAGLTRDVVSRVERRELDGVTVGSLSRLAEALDAKLVVEMRWQGADLDRLLDRRQAALQDSIARRFTACGWTVRVEVSFNQSGDRGRCDLVALYPAQRVLVIAEVKSALGDVQETLGRLDVKVRLGTAITRELGWQPVTAIVPALVISGDRTSRRVVARHGALFAGLNVRGRSALASVRRPRAPLPTGLLWFESLPDSDEGRTKRVQRVRRPRGEG